jgi:urate oxidase
MTVMGPNAYGKSRVRLVRVLRGPDRHDVRDLVIDIRLEGDFEPAYTEGDNRSILPTDTMKNAVYVLAGQRPIESVPLFALRMARHFLELDPTPRTVVVEIEERPWHRIRTADGPHMHAFRHEQGETAICVVRGASDRICVEGGLRNLQLLKTGGSGFSGFRKDELTTLEETSDRLLATSAEMFWSFRSDDVDYERCHREIRDAVLETFAVRPSNSLQQLLYEIGDAALRRCEEIEEIRLRLSNNHHLPVDLVRFGQENHDEVYVALSEPFGLIEGTVRR